MDPDQPNAPGYGEQPRGPADPARAEGHLGRELGGDLPCVVCGYNLRGLSIRGVCPECGAGVRATILAVVDPQANVLQPIPRPRIVAASLLLWSIAGLGASVVCWIPHFTESLSRFAGPLSVPTTESLLIGLIAAAMVGAAGLIRPHAGIPRWYTLASIVAVVLHAPLAWALVRLHAMGWPPTRLGTRWVLVAMGSLAAIFLLMRPTLRLLVARSLLLRSGRVDRQTLFGMAGAAAVVALGQVSLWWSIEGSPAGIIAARILGVTMLVTGGALLTLGLFGCVVDSARIARAILRPLPTLREVLRGGTGPSGRG